MRQSLIIVFAVVALGALNYGVYQKEQILKDGETVLLELAPVDPRSLLQGDYMRLRYAMERKRNRRPDKDKQRGHVVIRKQADGVAEFVRFYNGKPLQNGEKVMRYHLRYRSFNIKPDTFLFQEGHRKPYEQAKYGVFKFDKKSNYLLVGLADKDKKVIRPE